MHTVVLCVGYFVISAELSAVCNVGWDIARDSCSAQIQFRGRKSGSLTLVRARPSLRRSSSADVCSDYVLLDVTTTYTQGPVENECVC